MNEVNFLPQSYIRRQAARRRVYRQIVLVAVFFFALVGWWLTLQMQTYQLREQVSLLDGELKMVSADPVRLQQVKAQYDKLSHQVKVQRELVQPISFTQVLATISTVLPAQVSLKELRVEARRPKPLTEKELKDKKNKPADPNAKPPDNLIHIEMEAIAPSEFVSQTVESLSDHPVFSKVKLRYSRETELNGHIASVFQIVMQIDLDADYLPPVDREEVAGVD